MDEEGRRGVAPDRLALLVLVVAWAGAMWVVFAFLPDVRQTLKEFHVYVDPVSQAVLDHSRLAAPILAGASLAIALTARPALHWRLALLVIPLLLAAGGWLIRHHYVGRLLEALSR